MIHRFNPHTAFSGCSAAQRVRLIEPLLEGQQQVLPAAPLDCFVQNVAKITELAFDMVHGVPVVGHLDLFPSAGNLSSDCISYFLLLLRGETFIGLQLMLQLSNFRLRLLDFRI